MSEPRRTGLFASLKGLLGTSLTLLQTRLQLLATELEEERQRLLALLLWGAVAVLALGAGAIFLAVFLTVLLWDSQRLLVLGIASALFLGGGGLAAWLAWRLGRMPSGLFADSLSELSRDRAALRENG
ncbi:MAG TPA: phage holin family protein, partial [Rhodocyclaceae bacterium]|nr:phage holin family protein [Rhodocyclaceae bacterium]